MSGYTVRRPPNPGYPRTLEPRPYHQWDASHEVPWSGARTQACKDRLTSHLAPAPPMRYPEVYVDNEPPGTVSMTNIDGKTITLRQGTMPVTLPREGSVALTDHPERHWHALNDAAEIEHRAMLGVIDKIDTDRAQMINGGTMTIPKVPRLFVPQHGDFKDSERYNALHGGRFAARQNSTQLPGWPEFDFLPTISALIYGGLTGKLSEEIERELQHERRYHFDRSHNFDSWKQAVVESHPATFKPLPEQRTRPVQEGWGELESQGAMRTWNTTSLLRAVKSATPAVRLADEPFSHSMII
jgi:hypothetical protein